MIFKLLFLAGIFFNPDSTGTDLRFHLEKQIQVKADFFTTDRPGNIYLVYKDQLTKFSSSGDSLYSQSFKTLGTIHSIDASNGLKVVLFYPELTQVAVLDNTLSLQGEIVKLESLDLQFATLLCQSLYYNQLWIYTTEQFRLLRVDYQFETIRESGNLAQIIGRDINPTYLSEGDQRVYLNDPENGVHVFDLFGTFIQTLPVKDVNYFQVHGDYLYYLKKKSLHAYHLKVYEDYSIPLPREDVRHFRIERNKIYLLGKDSLSIFSIG